MAKTVSTMPELGMQAPDFNLQDVISGQMVSLHHFAGLKTLLVMFICQHCPYVKHVEQELANIGSDYAFRGLGIVAISSNDASQHPEDAPEKLRAMAQRLGFNFPYCHDADQSVAKAYKAACTPDFFLFNEQRELIYRGQLDDSRPGTGQPVTGQDVRQAIDAALSDKPIAKTQKPSLGCNIKWKRGREPEYFAA